MFKGITWGEYIIFVAVGLALVFGVIGIVLYRKKVGGLLKGGSSNYRSFGAGSLAGPSPATPKNWTVFDGLEEENRHLLVQHGRHPETSPDEEVDSRDLDAFIADVQNVLNGADRMPNRAEVMEKIRKLLHRYPNLRNGAYREVINDYLQREGRITCKIVIEQTELNALWEHSEP